MPSSMTSTTKSLKTRRTQSASPNTTRKTKSTARELTEYKMKPDKSTHKNTLVSRLNRSRSVSGRLPRLNMSDDFGRGLRANAIHPKKRTMRNYYYPKMPLDLQREVNEWVGPSDSAKKRKEDLHTELLNTHGTNIKMFEKRIRRNNENLTQKCIEILKMAKDFKICLFTYLQIFNRKGGIKTYAGTNVFSNVNAVKTGKNDQHSLLPLTSDNFQVVFDFHINVISGCPQALFTIVPTANVKEFNSITRKEKKKHGLYDGILSTFWVDNQVDKKTVFTDTYVNFIDNMEVSTRPSGVYVHEYVDDFEMDDFDPGELEPGEFANRPLNNDDYLTDPTICTNRVDFFCKYRHR